MRMAGRDVDKVKQRQEGSQTFGVEAQLGASDGLSFEEPDIVVMTAKHDTRFSITREEAPVYLSRELLSGQGLMIATQAASLKMLEGEACCLRLGVNGLAKLLAFIDEVKQPEHTAPKVKDFVVLEFDPVCATDQRALEYWFIRRMLAWDAEFGDLLAYLRKQEGYWLVKYLVAESAHQKTVSDLGGEYGLSYSHFRRVCKEALGNSVKSELKIWRAARSLLDVIDGRATMTEVAIKNGYASSSHFSTEVKNLFGLSPRAILNIDL